MTVASLLPRNATAFERALEQVAARALDIESDLRVIWSPDLCPIDLLPWLAWTLSLDNWSNDWSEGVKRERVRKALIIARSKGTVQSVRAVIASFGGSVAIREWWQKVPRGLPHTFDLVLNLDQAGAPASAAFVDQVIAEVRRVKPVRSHFTFTQGVSLRGGMGFVGIVRPLIYAHLQLTAPAAEAPPPAPLTFGALLAGTSALSATTRQAQAFAAHIAGGADLAATISQGGAFGAGLAGSADLSAAVTQRIAAGAALAGGAGLSAAIHQRIRAGATLAGESALVASVATLGTLNPAIDPGYFDDFETAGAINGRANWESLTPARNWNANGGSLHMANLYAAPSTVLFGPAGGLGGDVVVRLGYNTNDPVNGGGEKFDGNRANWHLWYIDDANKLTVTLVIPLRRLTISGVVGGAAIAPKSFYNVPIGYDERGEITLALTSAGLVRAAINGVWHKDAARYAYPYDALDLSTAIPVGNRKGRIGVSGETFDYFYADHIGLDVAHITIDGAPGFVGRGSKTATHGTLRLTGTYAGTAAAWAYRLLDAAGAPHGGWAAVENVAASAGAWAGDVALPVGGPWTVEVALKTSDDKWHRAISTRVLCGALITYYGQSNAVSRGSNVWPGEDVNPLAAVQSRPADAPAPSFATEDWPIYTKYVGYELARHLVDLIGIPVGVVAEGSPGAALWLLVPGSSAWTKFETLIDTYGKVEAVLWDQGEGDADGASAPNYYASEFQTDLLPAIRTKMGDPNLPVLPIVLGKYTGGAAPNGKDPAVAADHRNVLARQVLAIEAADPNCHIMSWAGGRQHSDPYHYTPAGYAEACRRDALTVARYVYGVACPDGAGPRVISAARSGATITLALDMRGWTGLTGAGLTGYDVSADNFATLLPKTSVEVAGNTIVITLASAPGGPVKIRSLYGWNFDESALAMATAAGIDPVPVFPILDPLTAA